MKRVTTIALLLAVFVCVAVSGARAGSIPLRLLLGKREIALSPSVLFDGKRVLAPLTILDPLGLSCVSSDGKSAKVVCRGGKSADIDTVDFEGAKMLAIDDIIGLTGGESNVDIDKRTITLTSHLKSVEFDDDTLILNNSFPVSCTARIWNGKLIVDLADTRLATETKEMYVGTPTVDRARLGQYQPDTARVTLDLHGKAQFKVMSKLPASQIKVLIAENLRLIRRPRSSPRGPFLPTLYDQCDTGAESGRGSIQCRDFHFRQAGRDVLVRYYVSPDSADPQELSAVSDFQGR